MRRPSAALTGALLSLFGAILFSTKAIFVKLAYIHEVDSISLLTLRMVFSLPFFLAIAWWSLSQNTSRLEIMKLNWRQLVLLGLSGFYIASYLDLEGLQYIDASLERIILFMYPTLVVLISFLWLKETIGRRQFIAIVVTYTGISLAFGGNILLQNDSKVLLGSVLVTGSAVSYALYLVGSQRLLFKLGTWLYNSVTMTVATAAILLHQVFINRTDMFGFSTPVYIYGLLIASVSTVIPSFMIMEGIRRIGANSSSIIGTVGPISTIILAYILLEERMNVIQWTGSLIVVGGVLFLILQRQQRSRTE